MCCAWSRSLADAGRKGDRNDLRGGEGAWGTVVREFQAASLRPDTAKPSRPAMERAQRALDAGGIVGQEEGPYGVSYTSRDLLIYALGVGSTSDMRYLYEGAPGFAAFPTFPLVLPYKGTSSDIVPFPGEPVSAPLARPARRLLASHLGQSCAVLSESLRLQYVRADVPCST